jgi:ABC-type microcin C transport system duplicated ATPase subunit YejF
VNQAQGKSVTCYSLLDLLPKPPAVIESGSANFDGVDLYQCSPQQMQQFRGNDIAMIFQDPMTSLNPFLTVGEQLIEPLIYHSDSSQRVSRSAAKHEAYRSPRRGRVLLILRCALTATLMNFLAVCANGL